MPRYSHARVTMPLLVLLNNGGMLSLLSAALGQMKKRTIELRLFFKWTNIIFSTFCFVSYLGD